jgi:hypothetical protein
MHAHQLADVAAVVCLHGQPLVAADPTTFDESLAGYWKASRCRLDRWGRGLRVLSVNGGAGGPSPNPSLQGRGIVEEIFVSEILVRAVAAIAVAHDERHGRSESAPVGRNVFASHIEARRRALAVVTAWAQSDCDAIDIPGLLALHRQCERWSDLLLAYLVPHVAVDEFAASPVRVHDFAYDARGHLQSSTSSQMTMTMVLSGLRSSLAPLTPHESPNADLNLEIAAAVLGCFSADCFDSVGLLKSSWLERIEHVPDETLAVLGEWWHQTDGTATETFRSRWDR